MSIQYEYTVGPVNSIGDMAFPPHISIKIGPEVLYQVAIGPLLHSQVIHRIDSASINRL